MIRVCDFGPLLHYFPFPLPFPAENFNQILMRFMCLLLMPGLNLKIQLYEIIWMLAVIKPSNGF
jgi:hypothetical protein